MRRIRTRTAGNYEAKWTTIAAVVCALAALVCPATSAAADRLIVSFNDSASPSAEVATLRSAGLRSATKASIQKNDIPVLGATVITVAEGSGPAMVAKLRKDSDVNYVEIDHQAHSFWVPNDVYLSQQWALSAVSAYNAWNTTTGTGATIAVVDTGVEYTHPDLSGRVDLGYDYVNNDANPADVQGHGTHVSGIISGIANNNQGIAGLAPGARILAVRVLDADGSGYYSWIASGIIYAADSGAKVINLSLGGSEASEALREAVDYATAKGSVVTCAAGNEGLSSLSYPARYTNCLSVAASNSSDALADFSNYGVNLDITAPGVNILSSVRGNSYESWSGTSMATPYVSALAGLLSAQGLNRAQIVSTMEQTADDLGATGYDTSYGYGRINAEVAVELAAQNGGPPADSEAPVINSVTIGAPFTVTTTKIKYVWRKRKTSKWRVSGSSYYSGNYTWSSTKTKGVWRYVTQYKLSRGVIRKRVITLRRRKKYVAIHTVYRTVSVSATDNTTVDRAGLAVDGHWIGTDWNANDGLGISWKCTAGSHTLTTYAFDAQDNVDTNENTQSVTC